MNAKTVYGQDSTSEKKHKSFFSIHSGIIFSEFIHGHQPEEYHSPGYYYTYKVTYFKTFDPGVFAGFKYEYSFSKLFSFVTQINYTALKKHIKYEYSSSSFAPSSENITANYIITASTIYLPVGLKRDFNILSINCGAYLNKPFNEKVITGCYKTQGYSFNNYPNNFQYHDTIYYNNEIKAKMHNEFGLYLSLTRKIIIKNVIFYIETSYGIGLIRTIKYPNYRNSFFIANIGIIPKRIK